MQYCENNRCNTGLLYVFCLLYTSNSCANVRAVIEAAAGRILVVPGIEVETAEEVHVACYFPDIDAAEQMGKILKAKLPIIKNETEIFGNQYYMNSHDEITGEEEFMLVNAVSMDIYEVFDAVSGLGGV